MVERIAVIGTGTWGTALAVLLAKKGMLLTLFCRSEEEAALLRREGRNLKRLPDLAFPDNLRVTADQKELADRTIVVVAVPAQSMRANCQTLRERLSPDATILSCTKGLELGTCARMSEVIAEELPRHQASLAVLSGPNLAPEIAAGLPAATVLASHNAAVAARLRNLVSTPAFRVYSNSDVIGVELGGALKNVIAIGAGFCDGLGLGDNAKAAVIGRGLAEITRLGVAAGARPMTFAGLAGLGDVIATCASRLSRNRRVGERLAQGHQLSAIQAELQMVAEGIATTEAAREMGRRYGVDMPIVEMTHAVLGGAKAPQQALFELMTRDLKDEFAAIVANPDES